MENDTLSPEDVAAYVEAANDTATSSDALALLGRLAEKQLAAEAKVEAARAALEMAEAELRDVAEREIPDLMDQCGIKVCTTKAGLGVSVDEKVRASISEVNKARAFAWLREHGHETLISRVISVAFKRGEDELAEAMLAKLDETEVKKANDKTTVNANTLAAWVREQLRNGKEVPLDVFGVHRQRRAKIDIPEPRGGKGDGGKDREGTGSPQF